MYILVYLVVFEMFCLFVCLVLFYFFVVCLNYVSALSWFFRRGVGFFGEYCILCVCVCV